jgi:hypothetical protein
MDVPTLSHESKILAKNENISKIQAAEMKYLRSAKGFMM